MKIGYARVSTADQSVEAQVEALKAAGCEKVFTEVASGAKSDRPSLAEALEYIRDGDVLVVYKLDRLARSLPHLIQVMEQLNQDGIGFQSLTEELNTTTPGGRLLFQIVGAIAEFERALIVERTQSGLEAARKKGRVGGRPKAMTSEKLKAAKTMIKDGMSVQDIAGALSVSTPTVYRHIKAVS